MFDDRKIDIWIREGSSRHYKCFSDIMFGQADHELDWLHIAARLRV